MTDIKYDDSLEDDNPTAELKFKSGDKEVSFRVSLEFEGDWLEFLSGGQEEARDDLAEQDARDGFAVEFFQRVASLF